MKRSKIFLGLTATVLGIAAFAASKAKFNARTVFYTALQNTITKTCSLSSSQSFQTSSLAGSQGKVEYGSNNHQYLAYFSSKCQIPVFTGAE